jgi:hypothetical protein
VVVDLVTSVLPRSFSKYWDYLGWLAALIITSAFPGKNSLRYDNTSRITIQPLLKPPPSQTPYITVRRFLNDESFRQARELMQHPLFPELLRDTVADVQALHLQRHALILNWNVHHDGPITGDGSQSELSVSWKRKTPEARSDGQIKKCHGQKAKYEAVRRAIVKADKLEL